MVVEMLASPELVTRYSGLSNTAFINKIYKEALGRDADNAGRTSWLEQIATYGKPQAMVNMVGNMAGYDGVDSGGLWSAKVFADRVKGYLGSLAGAVSSATSTSTMTVEEAQARIGQGTSSTSGTATAAYPDTNTERRYLQMGQLFAALVGRWPTSQEAIDWAGRVTLSAGNFAMVAQQMLDDAALTGANYPGGQGAEDFVRALYRLALARDPESQAALDFWKGRVTALATRGHVVAEFIGATVDYTGDNAVALASQAWFNTRAHGGALNAWASALAVKTAIDARIAAAADNLAIAENVLHALTEMLENDLLGTPLGGDGVYGGLASHGATPVVQHTVDRWGNVLSVTDALGHTSAYRWDEANQLLDTTRADGNGLTSSYYDALGRQIAARDANGNVQRWRYDDNGELVEELQADGGVVQHRLDGFGQRVQTRKANGEQLAYGYDALGNVTSMTRAVGVGLQSWQVASTGTEAATHTTLLNDPSPLAELYEYDELGRRIRSYNAAGESTTTGYDARGNVIRTTDALGRATTYSYNALNLKTHETQAGAPATMTWEYDGLRLEAHRDMGGRVTGYDYNGLGQLAFSSITRSGDAAYTATYRYDSSSGLLVGIDQKTDGQAEFRRTQYAYDLAGKRIRERTAQVSVPTGAELHITQDNHIVYDELGRMSEIADTRYHQSYLYDANGNRLHVKTTYRTPQWDYVPAGLTNNVKGLTGEDESTTVDSWNAYDAMNRQTVVDGVKLANGSIGIGLNAEGKHQGQQISYDNAGNRTLVRQHGKRLELQAIPVGGGQDEQGNTWDGTTYWRWAAVDGEAVETYSYDAAGRLTHTYRDGLAVEERRHDRAGRIVQNGPAVGNFEEQPGLYDALVAADIAAETRISVYNADGQLHAQRTKDADDSFLSFVTNHYDVASGRLNGYDLDAKGQKLAHYSYEYEHFDTSQVKVTTGFRDGKTATTTQHYDAAGHLTHVEAVNNIKNHEVGRTVFTDHAGRVLSRFQAGHVTHTLIANGEVLGSSSDSSSPSTFAANYVPVNDASLSGSTTYTVREGDTFQAIAKAVWGNADLWYVIAEANSTTTLAVGDVIRIPNKPNTVYNDFDTFKPYNPSEAVGDTTPNIPLPKKKSNWLKTLIVAIIAVVASVFLGPLVGGIVANALGGGAIATAVGVMAGAAAVSVVTQGVAVAIGAQEKFSWKQVGLAALSAGVAGPMGGADGLIQTGSTVGNAMVNAAVNNVVSQGIGVVTGLQKKFSWKAVAASAAAAGAMTAVGDAIFGVEQHGPVRPGDKPLPRIGGMVNAMGGGAGAHSFGLGVQRFVGAVAQGAVNGGKIDVSQLMAAGFGAGIGNALGSSLASAASSNPASAYDHRNGSDVQSDNYTPAIGAQAWNSGSLPDLYNRNFGLGTQNVDFRRNNGEYVVEQPASMTGPITPVNAPAIPEVLLPQGVDPRTVVSVQDQGGSVWYGMRGTDGEVVSRRADLFFGGAQGIVGSGAAGLDRGDFTPSQYMDAVRFLRNSGAPFDPQPSTFRVEVTGVQQSADTAPVESSSSSAAEGFRRFEIDRMNGGLVAVEVPDFLRGAGIGIGAHDFRVATPVPKPILPAADGYWTKPSRPGNSGWVSTRPSVVAITGGQPVYYRNKLVDFSPWAQERLLVPNMNGTSADLKAGRDLLAAKYGLKSDAAVQRWLKKEGLTLHHNPNGVHLEAVPTALHNVKSGGLAHAGGATLLRNWDYSKGTPMQFYRANQLAVGARYLGAGGLAYGAYADGKSLYGEYQMSQQTGNYTNTVAEGARVAGGWAGAWAVGSALGQFGAAFGTAFGPVGTVVGGVAGSAIGGVLGYAGGSYAAPRVLYDFQRAF